MEKTEVINKTEKPDSIKVSKGMNDKYSFEIKRYYDSEKEDIEKVIGNMKVIEDKLKFKDLKVEINK